MTRLAEMWIIDESHLPTSTAVLSDRLDMLLRKGTIAANEIKAAAELSRRFRDEGVWWEYYDDGRVDPWGVYFGSKGDSGRTLLEAMQKALQDRNLGEYWKAPDGRLAAEHFEEIAAHYLRAEPL